MSKLKRFARKFEFDPSAGKGGHGEIRLGDRYTMLRSARQKEIPKGTLRAMLSQLGIDAAEALILAEDCVTGALRGYIKRGWSIPRPSPARGRPTVTLPPLVAAKLALYEAMREQSVDHGDLAARLGMAEPAIRRLLDLDHRSHIDQVEAALRCLGKRLEVTVRDAA